MPRPTNRTSRLVAYENGKQVPFSPRAPIASSTDAPWSGFMLEQHSMPEIRVSQRQIDQHVMFVGYADEGVPPGECELTVGSKTVRAANVDGQFTLLPSGTVWSGRKAAGTRGVVVAIEPEALKKTAQELDRRTSDAELAPQLAGHDTRVHSLVSALLVEMEEGYPGGQVFGDSIGTALSVHLLQRYGAAPQAISASRGGLGPTRLRRVKDFVEEHLADDPSLASLAGVAEMSPYHFSRLFKQSTGASPRQYLLNRRIERAKRMVVDPKRSLSDVSAELGFSHQSHFTSVFRKIVGVTPGTYRRAVA